MPRMLKIAPFTLLSAVLLAAAPAPAAWAQQQRLVTVTGDAEIRVEPDEVVLTLGVESADPDLAVAKAQNDRRVEAVLEAARQLGVEPGQLQTDYLTVEPRYRDGYRTNELIEYVVRRNVVVRLRQVDRFEQLLSAVLDAGANYVHGIQFHTTELRELRDRARVMAVEAARDKAELLARALGQNVGQPHSISEGQIGWWSSYGAGWGGGGGWGGRMMQNVAMADEAGGQAAAAAIAPGQIAVTAQVTVSFALQ